MVASRGSSRQENRRKKLRAPRNRSPPWIPRVSSSGNRWLSRVFLSALERQKVPGGRLGRDGVAILSAMSARGLSFDHVLVPGLVERKFPALAQPDPLLSDEERNDVARTTARPLAEQVFPDRTRRGCSSRSARTPRSSA